MRDVHDLGVARDLLHHTAADADEVVLETEVGQERDVAVHLPLSLGECAERQAEFRCALAAYPERIWPVIFCLALPNTERQRSSLPFVGLVRP